MEKDEMYLIRLRDCFTAGYTLPQYCIDNGIKKPLFVSEEKFLQFMWEVYAQFRYDKRMLAQFAFIDLTNEKINFSTHNILGPLKYKNFSKLNPDEFDAIILLTADKVEVAGKVITLKELTQNFLLKTYVEIPTLNFLRRYPKVKLFYTNFPNELNRYEGGKELAETFVRLKILQKNSNETKAKSFRRRSTNSVIRIKIFRKCPK